MSVARLIACAAVLISSAVLPALSQDSGHVPWVEKSLETMHSVKVGMTRAELEKVFVPDGGLSVPEKQTYVYRECPYFKVTVAFKTDAANPVDKNDRIVRISKPYIDWPVGD
jgi:hypothetical protein